MVHGLPYFGKMFAELMSGAGWQFRFYPDAGLANLAALAWGLNNCQIAYQIGGRVTVGKFLGAARLLKKRAVVMHWAGSDALDERVWVALGKSHPWVTRELVHWAESDWMVKELKQLGVMCECIPLPCSCIPEEASPLPSRFSVLVHVPSTALGYLYGLDRILQVARRLPQIPFELVGLKEGKISDPPPNLRIHGRVSNLEEFYRRATVIWRPVRHDGLSFMVREALGHGRHVLYTYPVRGCQQVSCAEDAQEQILRLNMMHQLGRLKTNELGVRVVAENYSKLLLKNRILGRLEALVQRNAIATTSSKGSELRTGRFGRASSGGSED